MIWILAALAVTLLSWCALVCVVAWATVHPARAPLFLSPFDWQLPYEEVSFASRGGMMLSAWWIPHDRPSALIVLCHGYLVNRCEVLGVAATLHRAGFSCLLFDFRASGRSEGRTSTIGGLEVQDLEGALDWAEQHRLPIGAFGSSMGGAVAILTAAKDPRIGSVATDCAYACLSEAADHWLVAVLGPAPARLLRPLKHVAALLTGFGLKNPSPEQVVAGIAPRQLLIVHGENDGMIPLEHGHRLFAAAGEPRSLWIAPGCRHVEARATRPQEYYACLVPFFTSWAREQPRMPRPPEAPRAACHPEDN